MYMYITSGSIDVVYGQPSCDVTVHITVILCKTESYFHWSMSVSPNTKYSTPTFNPLVKLSSMMSSTYAIKPTELAFSLVHS